MADDLTITNDDTLYRKLYPGWIVGGDVPRISSAAFQNHPGVDKLSANLDSLMNECGQTWQGLLQSLPGYGMATVGVGDVRELNQQIEKAPEPDDPSHVHVVGKKTKSIQKRLAKAAQANVLRWPTPQGSAR